MKIKVCDKCETPRYHYVWLTYSSNHFEVISTVCAECMNTETFIVPVGTWYKFITGEKLEDS